MSIDLNFYTNNPLDSKSYQFEDTLKNSRKHFGFIAQDVEPLFPSVVGKTVDDKTKEERSTLSYASFGVLAIGVIKELNEKFEKTIKESNDKFEKALEKLTKKVTTLAKKVK